MAYLVVYVNGEKFTPEIEYYDLLSEDQNYPGDYYTLKGDHVETTRLAEFLNVKCPDPRYTFARVSIEKVEKGGFFGKKIVDIHYFEFGRNKVEFSSDLVYLEE